MKIAADSMGMPMKQFLKEIERGNVEATNFVKVFSKAFGDFADPAYREAQKKTFFQFSQFMSEFDRFKISIFKSGLGDTLSSIFMSLRHALMLITPAAEGVAQAISIAFHTATADIRLTVAWLLDVAEAMGLIDDQAEDTGTNWIAIIAGLLAGAVALVAKFRLLGWVLKGIGDILKTIGGAAKSVLPKGLTSVAGTAAGSTAGRAVGAAASTAGKGVGRFIPWVGTALIAGEIIDTIAEAAIGDTAAGKWMKETTLGDLWDRMGPSSAAPTPTEKSENVLVVNIEGDLSEAVKVELHSDHMNLLSNMGH